MSNIIVVVGPLPESVVHVPGLKVVSITPSDWDAVKTVKALPTDVRAALLATPAPVKPRKDKCIRFQPAEIHTAETQG